MKKRSLQLRITSAASVILGLLFFFSMIVSTHANRLQFALIGLLIGASIVWIIHLALWFLMRGASRPMFPAPSRLIVARIRQTANLTLTEYQSRMFVETVGAMLTISTFLVMAAVVFFIVSGMLYILGQVTR